MRSSGIAMLVLVAAASSAAAQQTADFRWTGRLAPGGRLEVKGVNGDIRAVAASGNEIVVTAAKRARRSDPEDVKIEVVQFDGGVTICAVYPTPMRARRENVCEPGDAWHSSTENNDVKVDFEVQVPAGIEFAGQTVNGEMSAEGLKGDVKASSVNGDIDSDYPLTVTGKFGPRRVRGTIGAGGRTLNLSTVNGEIRLKKST